MENGAIKDTKAIMTQPQQAQQPQQSQQDLGDSGANVPRLDFEQQPRQENESVLTSAEMNGEYFMPLSNFPDLDDAQRATLLALRERALEMLGEKLLQTENLAVRKDLSQFTNDQCLLRYLRANGFALEGASKMFSETLNWRQQFAPALITAPLVEPEAVTGKCYVNGFDRCGRPIVYIRPGRENTSSYDRQLQYFVFVMENSLRMMPSNVDRFVVIMDFEGYSLSSAPPLATTIELLKIFSNHYPERLARLFLLNTPWLFSGIYRLLTPFIRATTQAKIFFLSLPSNRKSNNALSPSFKKTSAHEQIWQFIDPQMLERSAGGRWEFEYDHNKYWTALLDKMERSERHNEADEQTEQNETSRTNHMSNARTRRRTMTNCGANGNTNTEIQTHAFENYCRPPIIPPISPEK